VAEQKIFLFPLYQGWDNYQKLLVKAIESLTPDQLALRAAPRLRSVGENAAHIVGTRAGWVHFQLERGDEALAKLAYWNAPDHPALSAAELVKGLEFTWQVIEDTLNDWTTADLDHLVYDTDDNGEEHTYTRQWVLWHLIEHDAHHGGELSYTLGIHGLPGIAI
jgi:uncharacterized damage-inducible protein DinB